MKRRAVHPHVMVSGGTDADPERMTEANIRNMRLGENGSSVGCVLWMFILSNSFPCKAVMHVNQVAIAYQQLRHIGNQGLQMYGLGAFSVVAQLAQVVGSSPVSVSGPGSKNRHESACDATITGHLSGWRVGNNERCRMWARIVDNGHTCLASKHPGNGVKISFPLLLNQNKWYLNR